MYVGILLNLAMQQRQVRLVILFYCQNTTKKVRPSTSKEILREQDESALLGVTTITAQCDDLKIRRNNNIII
jgi:hypothetical protein